MLDTKSWVSSAQIRSE